ncbi:MAG: tetratricopeptide repeat protein [Ignavibacteria bacterium]|nr:tetratricopeptide repeat protein [Ignavibacteria bacterium]
MLGQQYFENKNYQDYFGTNFVLFRADRAESKGEEVFNRFNIRATPTVLLLGSDGSEIDWHVGYGPPAEKYHERIDKSVKGIETFKFYADRYKKDPKNVPVVFNLAMKYDRRYDQDKARDLYKQVLALDPEGKAGTTEYGKSKVSYSQFAEFQIGALAMYGAKADPELLKMFIKKYPDSEMTKAAYQRMSSHYTFRAPKDEAKVFFEEYVGKYPDDPYVLSSYVSRIIRDKENLDKGIELAEKIDELTKYGRNPRYVKDRAELHALKGDKAKADEIYGKTFMEGEVTSLSYNLMDYANFWVAQKENTESALAMAEMALKLNPDNAYLIRQAATIFCKLDKLAKALEIYGPQAIEKDMNNASRLNSYADFWANQEKNLESALVVSKKAVDLSPKTYYYWGTLATVFAKLKQYDDAIRAGEKALELAPENQKEFVRTRLDAVKKEKEGK